MNNDRQNFLKKKIHIYTGVKWIRRHMRKMKLDNYVRAEEGNIVFDRGENHHFYPCFDMLRPP